jgi:hypothetical protein
MSFVNTNFLPYYYINTSNLFTNSLGIGTDSTSYNLEVVGDINFTGTLYQNGTEFVSGGGGGGVWTSNEDNTIYYLSSNVGIGITNPTQTLEVSGNIKSTNYISDIDTTNTSNILGNIGINMLNVTNPGTPEAQWAVSVDGNGVTDDGYSVAVDADYNVYLAGYYGSFNGASATIYNANNVSSGLTLRASGGAAFVVKYNSSGIAQWTVSVDSTNSDFGYSVAVDAYGNVYLGGIYAGIATIYNTNNTSSGLTLRDPGNYYAAFVVKYNSSGIAQWAVSVDGSASDYGYAVTVDKEDNVYLGGYYESNGVATIYNTGNTNSGLTLRDPIYRAAYVVKYNSSGIAQWAVSLSGDTSYSNGACHSVAVDSYGNLYMGGEYNSTGVTKIYNANNTDSGLTLRVDSGGSAAFVVKYNSSGIAQWTVSVDGSTGDYGYGVALDESGNVYLSGYYSSSGVATIYNTGNTASTTVTLRDPGNGAAFVVKYNSSGIAQWAVSVNLDNDVGQSVAVDASGNVYLAGNYGVYNTSATVYNAGNTSSGLTLRTSTGRAAFVVKYNSSGIAQWTVSVDSTNDDNGQCVAVDAAGNVYLAGYYSRIFDFFQEATSATIYDAGNEASGLTLRVPSGNDAAFLVKYSQTNMRFKLLNYSSSDNDGTIKNIVNTTPYILPVDIYSSDGTTVLSTIYIPPNSSREYLWYNNAWMLLNY